MKRDVIRFVEKCLTCQQIKAEHQRPTGTLQPLEIPEQKLEQVTMDFVSGLPRTRQWKDSLQVVVDCLTKSTYFIPECTTYTMDKLAELYIQNITRLHEVPCPIVSDRDSHFTSCFWKILQLAFRTKFRFSTAYHPKIYGQSERMIQILEDMLRACDGFPKSMGMISSIGRICLQQQLSGYY